MSFQDRTVTCVDCGSEFIFTAGEQSFYQERGFDHPPRRCKNCRAARKGGGGGNAMVEETRHVVQAPGWNGFPNEVGMFAAIQRGLREINTSTRMVAK